LSGEVLEADKRVLKNKTHSKRQSFVALSVTEIKRQHQFDFAFRPQHCRKRGVECDTAVHNTDRLVFAGAVIHVFIGKNIGEIRTVFKLFMLSSF
jgi:hypothetical protein